MESKRVIIQTWPPAYALLCVSCFAAYFFSISLYRRAPLPSPGFPSSREWESRGTTRSFEFENLSLSLVQADAGRAWSMGDRLSRSEVVVHHPLETIAVKPFPDSACPIDHIPYLGV
jgi:hypothetical protein